MNCEYIYGYPFYTFKACDELVNKVFAEIKDLTYEEVFYSTEQHMPSYAGYIVKDQIKTFYYDKDLYTFLNECLDSIYKKHFVTATEQTIVDLWATKNIFGRQSKFHSHGHSIFSGLLYLHDSKAPTIFKFEDQIVKTWEHFVQVIPDSSNLFYESAAIKGKVIIWPSIINHKIGLHREKSARHTIAFNSFWNGRMSSSETGFLELKTTTANEAQIYDKK